MVCELAFCVRAVPVELVEVERLDGAVCEILRESDTVVGDVRLFAKDGDLPFVAAT